jgi:hypothetical protein
MMASGQEASTLFGRRHDTVGLGRPRAVGPYVAQRLEFGVPADDRGRGYFDETLILAMQTVKRRLRTMSDQFEGGCLCGAVRIGWPTGAKK